MWMKNSVDPDQLALDLHCFQRGIEFWKLCVFIR